MASLLLIDPDGDVELLLRPERDLRMVWEFAPTPSPSSLGYRRGVTPEAHQGKTKEKARIELEPRMETEQEQAAPLAKIPPAPNTEEMRARIRVSFRHLMLASAYFKRSLGGELSEGHTLRYEGRVARHEHDPRSVPEPTIFSWPRRLDTDSNFSRLSRMS
jgi:hypothetical protein